jgi:hypothetical protein
VAMVIDHRHPLGHDRLQLVEEEGRLTFRIHPARGKVGSLAAGQGLQQVLAQRAEEPLQLISGLTGTADYSALAPSAVGDEPGERPRAAL